MKIYMNCAILLVKTRAELERDTTEQHQPGENVVNEGETKKIQKFCYEWRTEKYLCDQITGGKNTETHTQNTKMSDGDWGL